MRTIRVMDSITRDVADIDAHDREALEHVIGHSLADDQRVIISVAPAAAPGANVPAAPSSKFRPGISTKDSATKRLIGSTSPFDSGQI